VYISKVRSGKIRRTSRQKYNGQVTVMSEAKEIRKPGNKCIRFVRRVFRSLPGTSIAPLCIISGILIGLSCYTAYIARLPSYLADDPSACVNCHIMSPYYQSWSRSSHAAWTNCNECHIPQGNLASGYMFKALDGIYHAAMFTLKTESQPIRPRDSSSEVILENCIRCHTQLNAEFVKTGMASFTDVKNGRQAACWDCHRNVPHTTISSLSSSPNAVVPFPSSPVPEWLKAVMQ
jgi:cytochrome c nitrite reductase small subunit